MSSHGQKNQEKQPGVQARLLSCTQGFVRILFNFGELALPGICSFWQRSFMRVGLLVLALNIVLVSIPRCDTILAVFQYHGILAPETAAEGESCHDTTVPSDGKSKAWTSHRICECSVLQFMAFHMPELNLNEHVAFRIQSERLLTFPWSVFLSDFQVLIDPPYPKA